MEEIYCVDGNIRISTLHPTCTLPVSMHSDTYITSKTTNRCSYSLMSCAWRSKETKLYDKGDDFNFPIVNFRFICSNIPVELLFEVYTSQLTGYSSSYQIFP